ncbi:hypothetical protein CMI45_03475 [Candidatus Pacearchaeota archaeon]|nr:hypothetical protein [Candidatus Pacearchaeota archaeon]|tara:strand:+ start:35 stop:643 length:609 start_codon:yes stop_codon:yes gene_type:complete
MAEEKIKTEEKKKQKDINTMSKKELGKTNTETKKENKTPQASDNKEKPEEKKEEKKKTEAPKLEKKDLAIAKSLGLHASKKHCMYICDFIKGKNIDKAISDLQSVINMKQAIPFKGEIPHRKGKMMSGRYPVKACTLFIPILRGLKGNVIVNQLDSEKTIIKTASASWASRPMRKGNVEGKRTNVVLTAEESNPKQTKENKK